MAKKIGGVYAELMLRDGDFRTRLNRASIAAQRAGKDIAGYLGKGLLAAGTAATGAGVALGYAMMRASEAADAAAKNADRLGIATQSYAAMRVAADLAGVPVEGLTKGLKEMTMAGIEAASGSKPMQDAFARLGISVERFNQLKPDEQFRMVAAAMGNLATQSERAYVAQQLFGKGGFDMLPILQNGSAALEEGARFAELYGLAINRMDAAKLEAANDSMTRMKQAAEGFALQLAVKAAPAITGMISQIDGMIAGAGGMEGVAGKVGDAMVEMAAKSIDALAGLRGSLGWVATGALQVAKIATYNPLIIPFTTKEERQASRDALTAMQDELMRGSIRDFGIDPNQDSPGDKFRSGVASASKAGREASMNALAQRIQDSSTAVTDQLTPAVEAAAPAMEKLAVAAEKVADTLSASEVAARGTLGTKSGNKSLAVRAERLRSKAAEAEADGRFEAADRMRAQAESLDARIKRRPVADATDKAEQSRIAQVTAVSKDVADQGGMGLGPKIDSLVSVLSGIGQRIAVA